MLLWVMNLGFAGGGGTPSGGGEEAGEPVLGITLSPALPTLGQVWG